MISSALSSEVLRESDKLSVPSAGVFAQLVGMR